MPHPAKDFGTLATPEPEELPKHLSAYFATDGNVTSAAYGSDCSWLTAKG